ncbi:potassium channel family protein [Pseudomonas sp. LS44]|uniref:potassium channel family protein n=1 Tax=Pseudomonas sp. LS44 TaxID=1357074 RepID=UPI00215A931A|nr:potassium channel family protein [Pseudomonas sp. LS44]UVE15982.1 potassium channel family protein [Pseudomonas sp. LS44]
MLLNFLVGLPVMLLCLLLQALFVTLSLRQYVRGKGAHGPDSWVWNTTLLSLVMLIMLLGNFVQMGIWAALFMLLGEFDSFATALYFSGVTFATLGYGDVVMSARWRLLSPLEAANGILMFGVSTAVMTAAVMDVIKRHTPRSQQHPDD